MIEFAERAGVIDSPEYLPLGEAADPVLDLDSISGDLGPHGVIAAEMGAYEDRPTQREMAVTVAQHFNDGGVALIEAGTGVGKSLAYLLPALRWSALSNERTVVSTNTINLQEQLIGKDLPFLAGALGNEQPIRFAILKGWRNYICLQRLDRAAGLGSLLFDAPVAEEISALRDWAATTKDGTLSDLPVQPSAEAWDEVAAEPDLCSRAACPAYQKCFFFAARRKAAEAQVLVVNHHLLMADVAVRRALKNWEEVVVLPPYKRLVIDEGHHLEEAAASHLGASASRRSVLRLFARLEKRGKGLLPTLEKRFLTNPDLLNTASLELLRRRVQPELAAAREKGAVVFDLLEAALGESGQPMLRLTADFAEHPVWKRGLDATLSDLLSSLSLIQENLEIIQERLGARANDTRVAPLILEMIGVARRLEAVGDALDGSLRPAPGELDRVRWIESRGNESNVAVNWVPLDLAPIIRDDLFAHVKTCIVTSATLAAEGSFDFVRTRLGLDSRNSEPTTVIYESPFDYQAQAVFAIPTDFPAPNVDQDAHFNAVIEASIDLCNAADGGIFVLFTSHRDVRLAASELRARGLERQRPLLVHGENGRDQILQNFRASERAMLLGTSSFWEGVDVPGRALRGLLIARIPFRVPTDPMTAAHCEAIQANGGDPFTEYMLPHASLRLKQGFGRLIRSSTDRGAVVLADPRVLSKNYGEELLKSLPNARRIVGDWSEIKQQLNHFYSVSK